MYPVLFLICCICGLIQAFSKDSYTLYTGKKPKNRAHDHYVFFIDH